MAHWKNVLLIDHLLLLWTFAKCSDDSSRSDGLGNVKTSTSISVLKNSRVILPCEFRTEGVVWYSVAWEKQKDSEGDFVTVAEFTRGESQPRFEPKEKVTSYISEGREKLNFDLVITRVENEDAAAYRCRVFTSSGETMSVTNLQVSDSDVHDETDYPPPDPVSDGDLALYVGLPLALLVLILILVIALCYVFRKRRSDWPTKFMQPRKNSLQDTDTESEYHITHIYSSVRSSYRSSLDKSQSTEQTVASISSSEYEVPVTTSTGTSASEESYDSPSPPYLIIT